MNYIGIIISLIGATALLSSLFTYELGIVGGIYGIAMSVVMCGLFFIMTPVIREVEA